MLENLNHIVSFVPRELRKLISVQRMQRLIESYGVDGIRESLARYVACFAPVAEYLRTVSDPIRSFPLAPRIAVLEARLLDHLEEKMNKRRAEAPAVAAADDVPEQEVREAPREDDREDAGINAARGAAAAEGIDAVVEDFREAETLEIVFQSLTNAKPRVGDASRLWAAVAQLDPARLDGDEWSAAAMTAAIGATVDETQWAEYVAEAAAHVGDAQERENPQLFYGKQAGKWKELSDVASY